MAEEYSLDNDPTLEINDSIDKVLFDDQADPIIEQHQGVVKDEVETIKVESEKRRRRRERREKKLKDETDRYSKELKDQAKKEKRHKFWKALGFPIAPSTLVRLIQFYEEPVFVSLVNLSVLGILFSLLYTTYIILSFDPNELILSSGKLVGTVILFTLSLVVQINVNQGKGKK